MSTFAIREFTEKDEKAIAELNELVCKEVYFDHQKYQEDLPNPIEISTHGIFLVAEDYNTKKIIGYGGIELLSKDHAKLKSIRTHPMYRRRGIATSIIKRLEDHARNNNVSVISLVVANLSKNAIKLYKEIGYEVFKYKPLSSEKQVIYMARHLNKN